MSYEEYLEARRGEIYEEYLIKTADSDIMSKLKSYYNSAVDGTEEHLIRPIADRLRGIDSEGLDAAQRDKVRSHSNLLSRVSGERKQKNKSRADYLSRKAELEYGLTSRLNNAALSNKAEAEWRQTSRANDAANRLKAESRIADSDYEDVSRRGEKARADLIERRLSSGRIDPDRPDSKVIQSTPAGTAERFAGPRTPHMHRVPQRADYISRVPQRGDFIKSLDRDDRKGLSIARRQMALGSERDSLRSMLENPPSDSSVSLSDLLKGHKAKREQLQTSRNRLFGGK